MDVLELLRLHRCASRLRHVLPFGMLGLHPRHHVHSDRFTEHLAAARVNFANVLLHALQILRRHRLAGENRHKPIALFVQDPMPASESIRPTPIRATDDHVHAIIHGGIDLPAFHRKARALMRLEPVHVRKLLRKRNRPILSMSPSPEQQNDD